MKKFKLLLSMLMLVCFSMGTWAADELKATLDFTSNTAWNLPEGSTAGLTDENSYSNGTYTIKLSASTKYYYNTSGYLMLGKTGSKLTLPAFSWKTTKIVVTGRSGASASVGQNIYVGSTEVSTATIGAAGSNTYNINSSYQDAGNVYVLQVTTNANTQITKIEIYGESSSTSPSISIEQNGSAVTTVDFGEIPTRSTDPDDDNGTTQTIDVKASNLTGDVYLQIDNTDGNYYYIYDPRYASAYFAYFTLKPKNGAIDTSLVLDVGSWDATGTITGKLKVSSKASTPDFTAFNIDLKVNIFELKPGDYEINLNNTFFGVAKGNNAEEQSGSLKCIELVSGCASTASTKPYYDAAHVRYYKDSYLKICAPEGYVIDTIIFTPGDTWNDNTIEANVGKYDDSKKEWSGAFRCVTFDFGAQDRIKSAKVSIVKAPKVGLPIISGQTPFYPSTTVTLSCETSGAEMHYTTSGDDPTGGDQTYSKPFTLTETKTVKVIAIKNTDVSEIASKTFTKATPKTVAQAMALVPNAGDTENDQFVVGYVCTVGTEVSSGQMTYYISDNGSTVDEGTATTDRIQIYKGKGLNNADFSAASDLAVGDSVVVYGQLKNYNGVYELNSGNYIVEYVKKELKAVSVSGKLTQTEYDYGDQLNVAGLKATAYYTVGANVDVTNDPGLVWTKEGKALSESLVYGGNSFVQASYGGKTSAAFNITTTVKTYALTFSAPSNGTLVIKDALGNEKSSGDKFWKTEPLTVFATPSTGYKLDKVTVLKASDDSDVTSEVLNGKDLKMPNYAIKVSASFTKVSYGKLEITPNKINYGVVKVGGTVTDQAFTLKCSGFTKGDMIYIQAPKGFTATTTSFGINNEDGTREYGYIFIIPSSETLSKAGVYDGNVVISSDGMAADSIVPVKLTVGGVITTTPSPVAIDLGDVLYKDELTQYGKSFHLNIKNLAEGKYNQVRVNFLGDDSFAFDIDGSAFVTDNDQDGVIDQDVTIIPSNYGMTYGFDQIKGSHTATIQINPTSSTSSLVSAANVGTVTMNIVAAYGITVADITGGSLTWNGGAAPKVAKENATFTLAAVPALGYKNGVIKVVKAADETDITSTVLKDGVLTMPAYAIKVYVTFESGQQDPQLSWSGVDSKNRAWAYMEGKPNVYPTLNAPEGLEITYSCADGDGIITLNESTGAIKLLSEGAVHIKATSKATAVYTAGEATYTLYVCGVDVISLGGTLAKTAYEYGDAFDRTGLTVTATYTNDGGTADITEKVKWSIDPETITKSGSVKVVVTYGYQTDDKWISVTMNTHAVSWEKPSNGSMTVYDDTNNPFASGTKFRKGRTFKVETTAASGYQLKSLKANNEDITSTKEFTMGTSDIELVATFEEHKDNPDFEWKIGDEVVKDVYVTYAAKDNVFPTLSNPHNLGKYFYSSNTDVARINLTSGYIALQGGGEATIKAWFWGTTEYEKDSAEYVLHVAKGDPHLQWNKTITNDSISVDIYGSVDARQLPHLYDPLDAVVVTSSNEEVVKINTSSKYPELQYAEGDAVVTATYVEDNKYKGAQISYKVHAYDGRFSTTLKWRIDNKDVEGATVTLGGSSNVFPTLYNPRGFTPAYTSSDESKATIASDGTITLKATGTTTITAKVDGNYTYKPATASYTLTINAKEAVDPGLAWSATSANARYGSTNTYPTLTKPEDLTVTYSSSNTSVATINAETGAISLKANGTTTITASSEATEDYLADQASYTLNVSAGIVTVTPNPVALDLGEVLLGDDPAKYGKSFHLHIENLNVGEYNEIVVSPGSEFWTASSSNHYVDNDRDGVIDQDVTIVPGSYTMGLTPEVACGTYKRNISIAQAGTRLFEDVKVGTVTMTIVEAYAITVQAENGSLTFNNDAAPKVAKPDTEFTLKATPDEGYKANGITVLKASDDSDVTTTVLENNVLTMPKYAIKVVASFVEGAGTGMEQVEAEMPARKVLIDGQLFILRGGKIYDAAGLLVK